MTEPSPPARPPIDLRAEADAYDRAAEVGVWPGPRYRMTYRLLGQGPPLILVPGIASTYRGYALTLKHLAPRFRTILYDYPGEQPDDGARKGRIRHEDLVDDVFGLLDHLGLGPAYLFGLSFGSTIVLQSLQRDPNRFVKAAIQGGFARRRFRVAERLALLLGRRIPGRVEDLPFRRAVLNSRSGGHFPADMRDRWAYYLEQNGLTPIGPMVTRLDLLARLDLRPILAEIPTEVLLIQGTEDRIVDRRHFDELRAGLPHATAMLMPGVGHQPHYTHPEDLARAVGDFFLPPPAGG